MSLQVSAKDVKNLRDKTGAGMMDCKKALQVSKGNIDIAIEELRKKGVVIANKKAQRSTMQGLVESYIHVGSKIGVLLELNCETDFVARRSEFRSLAKNIAMQIAANVNVHYIDKANIPREFLNSEEILELKREDIQYKPITVRKQIAQARVQKKLSELCLLSQPFIKNPDITIKELLEEHIASFGENIKINRFSRFVLGDLVE